VKRKAIATMVITLFLTLAVMALPLVSVSAQPMKPLRCEMELTFDLGLPDPHWIGTVTGDIEGTIEFWEFWDQNYVVGKTEHFFERFLITTDGGDTIEGFDQGVWNFGTTFKFRANGWVTEASGDWAYLVGYKMFEIGMTSPFPPSPVYGTATMILVYG